MPEHQPRLLSGHAKESGLGPGLHATQETGGQLGISARMAQGKWKGKNSNTKASTK